MADISDETLDAVALALISLVPSHRDPRSPCWCARGWDCENWGHSDNCLRATAALARLREERRG